MPNFAGFVASDFEAYAPKKWKSNVFTRERLEVKQKLIALGRHLESKLVATDGSLLFAEPSVEYPALWNHKQVEAQHLYFSRNEGARKELDAIIDRQHSLASMIDDPTPQRNHVFLAISVGHESIDMALKLHPDAQIDRQNWQRKCEDHFEREKFLSTVQALGEAFRAGVMPEIAAASAFDDNQFAHALTKLGKSELTLPGTPPKLFYVGRAVPMASALQEGPALTTLAERTFAALLPLYRFIAWSRDNDFVSIRETLQKEKQAKRQKGLSKNDSVRIVRGMFAGKAGVVQEVDAKGGLKVLVGKMAVKVDVEDVTKS